MSKGKLKKKVRIKTVTEKEKVMGFREGTQAARMYTLLADGKPRSVKEIHRVISDTTESNVANGLLYALRKRGYETGQFHIVNEDHKLRLVKGPKPTAKAKTTSKAKPKAAPKASSSTPHAAPMEAGAEAEA